MRNDLPCGLLKLNTNINIYVRYSHLDFVWTDLLGLAVVVFCLSLAVGREPINFILPEFVSYLGERSAVCVGNGLHFCTPVLMKEHVKKNV